MPFCNLQIQCVLFVVYTVYTNYTIKSDILIRIHNLFHGEVSIFIVQLDDAAVAQDAFILLLDVGNSLQETLDCQPVGNHKDDVSVIRLSDVLHGSVHPLCDSLQALPAIPIGIRGIFAVGRCLLCSQENFLESFQALAGIPPDASSAVSQALSAVEQYTVSKVIP